MDSKEAIILLTDYVKGSLSEEQRVAVENHIETNPECRETVAFLKNLDRDLTQHSELFDSGHPDAEELVSLALDGTKSEDLANHVSECLLCFEEIQKIRKVYSELVLVKPKKKKVTWLLAAVLMVVIIAVIYIPQGDWSGSAPVIHVKGVMRSADYPEVVVGQNMEQLPMVIQWNPWEDKADADNYNLTVSILDKESSVLKIETTAGEIWDDTNKISSLVVSSSSVGYGLRTVQITDETGDIMFTGQFQLTLQ